ncbi:uncharacterized protein LOC143283484 [Babylonia areolata]|uniref:uncharacterized protein LOC143283484 n=1 Tax=Babylonia areolata TaxID=304850 RepID=UPI003FD156CA
METCQYEQLRQKNLEDNRRILAELGLSNPYRLLPKVIKKGIKRPGDDETYQPKKKKARAQAAVDLENSGSIHGPRRLSARLRGQLPGTECLGEDDQVESEHEQQRVKYQYVMPDRPNWYGEVPGVEVGTIWTMRIDCCHDGIHRPPVAGIHGGPDGAYSIALSGGYEDDVDLGDCFTYTGEGGRDLKGTRNNPKNLRTAPQSKDQDLTRGNLALSRSVETGNPVRVIRGYKLRSPFAPDEGYRYDGLYTVEKFWFTKGLSGFGVYKFALRRCGNQAPPPWLLAEEAASPSKSSDSGFSDSANCDAESSDGQKSESGDSDAGVNNDNKVDDSENGDGETSDVQNSEREDSNTGVNSDNKVDDNENSDGETSYGQKSECEDGNAGVNSNNKVDDSENGDGETSDGQKSECEDSSTGVNNDNKVDDSENGDGETSDGKKSECGGSGVSPGNNDKGGKDKSNSAESDFSEGAKNGVTSNSPDEKTDFAEAADQTLKDSNCEHDENGNDTSKVEGGNSSV